MQRVKKKRRYDSDGRRAASQRTRDAIIDAARDAFARNGYAATTVASIAAASGVSVETLYKGFGGKPGLVRAICERGLAGSGPTPAFERSDAMSAREDDPFALVKTWGKLAAEVSPLVSPILLLVRSAASADPELASLLDEIDHKRLERMRHNARVLSKRGFLRDDITIERAADIAWMSSSFALYELLVVKRGWSSAAYGDFVGAILTLLIKPKKPRGKSSTIARTTQ